jgi:hypothetical protein
MSNLIVQENMLAGNLSSEWDLADVHFGTQRQAAGQEIEVLGNDPCEGVAGADKVRGPRGRDVDRHRCSRRAQVGEVEVAPARRAYLGVVVAEQANVDALVVISLGR